MAYQGSASSIGFRSRPVLDGSKRKRQEAQEIEQQGQRRIRGMERQASQQLTEMRRQADIAASNSSYELKALAKFSDSINNVLQNEALDAVKQIKEDQIEEGKRIHAEQGAAFQTQKDEVDQAGNQSYALHTRLNEVADKAPDDESGDQIRKLSRWQQHGYDLAAMQETGGRFGMHLMAELEDNTTMIVDPDTGAEFPVNKQDKTRSEFEAAKKHIFSQYVLNNNPNNLSDKVVNTVLIPEMQKTGEPVSKEFYSDLRVKEGQEMLDTAELTFAKGMDGVAGYPTDPTLLINGFLSDVSNGYKKMGLKRPRFQARQDLYQVLYSRAEANPHEVEDMITQIEKGQILNHPGGEGNLFSLYSREISADKIRAKAYEAVDAKTTRERQALQREADAAFTAFRRAKIGGLSGPEERLAIEQLRQYEVDFPEKFKTALAFAPQIMNEDDSKTYADALIAAQGGRISEEQAEKLDIKVYNELKDNKVIVDELFTDDLDTKKAFKTIDDQLRRALGDNDTTAAQDYTAVMAGIQAKKELVALAEQIYEDGEGKLTKTQALEQALTEKSAQIKVEAASNDPRATYYVGPTNGFEGFAAQSGQMTGSQRVRDYNAAISFYTQKKTQDKDAVINSKLPIRADMLEPTTDGGPPKIFYDLARLDGNHNAWDIWLAQRNNHGIKEAIELPDDAKMVDTMLKQYPSLVPLFLKPSHKRIQRGLMTMGHVTPERLMSATGVQESGNDYKALNEQSYGPTNPAMGKYQILWTTAVGWAKQAGMPHPGSINEFLNDPAYQEEMARWAFGSYLKQASRRTDDPEVAIRMAAAAWYGGPGAMEKYDDENYQGGAPGHPNMKEYTMSVLRRYKRGE